MTKRPATALADTIAQLDQLIAFPTVSTDSNLDLISYAANVLTDLGAKVEVHSDTSGTKANLYAVLGPQVPGGVLLSGHSDVVPVIDQDWTSDPFKMDQRDDRLYGRGACDMKGFIAASLAMAQHYAAAPLQRPVHFAFTHDEETGCLGAQDLCDLLRGRDVLPSTAIIGEPTEMRIIEGHKGCCEYTTSFTGLPGHGSAPHLGVNAAEYAVRYITRLMELREEMKPRTPEGSRFDPPYTTMNIGGIRGGVAHNVIVNRAEVDWEFRPVNRSDFDFFKSQIADYAQNVLLPQMQAVYPQSDISTRTIGEVAGLEPMDDNAARALVSELTGSNGADVVAFGTEAGLFQSLGMDAVVCGPGSIEQAHKADEFVSLAQMEQCLDMLAGLGQKLCEPA